MNELNKYISELKRLMDLQQKLVPIASGLVHLKPANVGSIKFFPTANIISEQIRNWPSSTLFMPMEFWIEPSFGNIEFLVDTWEFSFQSQQVVFTNSRDKTYVRAEYSVKGDIGVTAWAMYLFLKSRFANEQIEEPTLVERNNEFFSYLIDCGKIKMIGNGLLGEAVSTYIP